MSCRALGELLAATNGSQSLSGTLSFMYTMQLPCAVTGLCAACACWQLTLQALIALYNF